MNGQPMEEIKELCIIAGNRNLPFVVAEQARKAGMEHITAIAFDGETDPRISEVVDEKY